MRKLVDEYLDKGTRYLQTDIRYILSGGFWLGVGQGTSLLLSFISAIVFANLIPKEVYGTYKYILSIAAILAIPTLSGMAMSLMQSVARGHVGAYMPALQAKLHWGMFSLLGGIILGTYYILRDNWLLGGSFIIAGICIPLIEGCTLWGAVLSGKKLFKQSTQYNTATRIMVMSATIITLLFTSNIFCIATAYFFSSAGAMYWAHRRVVRQFPDITQSNDIEHAVKFGKNMSFVGVIGALVGQLDTILLWHLFGAEQLAVYAFALSTTMPAKSFLKSIVNLAHPKYARYATHDLRQSINQKVLKSFVIVIPVTVLYIMLLPFMYQWFFPKYIDSLIYAQFLGTIFLLFPAKLYSVAVLTREDRRPTYILNAVNPLMGAVFLVILIPLLGVWGGVIATVLAHVSSTLTTYYYYRKMK